MLSEPAKKLPCRAARQAKWSLPPWRAPFCGLPPPRKVGDTERSVDDEAMVVPIGRGQSVDALSDAMRLAEIHRSVGDLDNGPSWNHGRIDRQILAAMQLEQVIVDRASGPSTKIEVSVVGEIDRSGFVGGGHEANGELRIVRPYVIRSYLQVTWIALIPIGARQSKANADGVF